MAALETEGNNIAFQGDWFVTHPCMVLLGEIYPTESLLNHTRIANSQSFWRILAFLQPFKKELKSLSVFSHKEIGGSLFGQP